MGQSRFCEQCGAALASGVGFCESCGQPVLAEAQAVPPVVPTTALPLMPLMPPTDASSKASPGGEPIEPRHVPWRPDRRLMVGLIGIAVVTVVVMRLARDRSPVTVNEPYAGPAFALTPTAVGLVLPTAPPETPGMVADSTPTSSSQPTVVAALGAVAGVSTSISPEFTVSSSEGIEAATPGLSPPPPDTPSPAVVIDLGASPPPSPQMAGDSGASAALVGRPTYLPLVRASKAAAKSAAAKDPVALLTAAQAQVAKLQRTRYTYQRTAFGNKRTGKGWLEMPDRAADTAGEQAELGQALRVWIKAQPFFRDSVQAEWKVSLQTVALADNPAVWLYALACGQTPRLRPAETIGKEKVDLIIFDLAPADPNTCDPYTGLSALTGQGAVYLRQRDGGIQRVRYDLKYSDTLHGGHRDMPLLVEIDLKDANSAALPPIIEPVSPSGRATPTAAPAAGTGATFSTITFSSEFDQDKVVPINPAKTFPYGVKIVYAYWTYSNVVPETEFLYDWYRDGMRVDGATEYFTSSSGKTFQWLLIGPTPKTPLDPGNYRFVVRVGDQEIFSDTFVIQR